MPSRNCFAASSVAAPGTLSSSCGFPLIFSIVRESLFHPNWPAIRLYALTLIGITCTAQSASCKSTVYAGTTKYIGSTASNPTRLSPGFQKHFITPRPLISV